MRTGIFLSYAGGFKDAAEQVVEFEKVGVDIALVAEAYSYDAISQLGYLAAKTDTIELGTGVVPIYVRTPTLLAMTAAGLDYVSDGRFRLGIGTSGPQVMEGFHGVPFDAPMGRTREVVDICRQVWRRERVQHSGKHYQIPLPADRGTGLGKPLRLINHPVRERIPITIAALGPQNVELTAEIAEGWQPVFFYPEKAHEVWGDALRPARPSVIPSWARWTSWCPPAWPSARTWMTGWHGPNPNWPSIWAEWVLGVRTSTMRWQPDTASAKPPTGSRICICPAANKKRSKRFRTTWFGMYRWWVPAASSRTGWPPTPRPG